MNTLGGRIADARITCGWSQAELAKKMGVSRATVSDWEKDHISNLKMENLVKLSELTNHSIGWLAVKRKPIYRSRLKSEEEHELIVLYRGMEKDTQKELLNAARRYHKSDHGDRPTVLDPWPEKLHS